MMQSKNGTALWTVLFIQMITLSLSSPARASDRLIVFTQPGASAVNDHFEAELLPEIRALAERIGVDLITRNAADGAPPEVVITPMIVFQNHRGRSIYQGRTTTLRRVDNFIRTSRFVPQGDEALVRENIPVWRLGGAKIWAPIKIAPVTGTPPDGYDHDEFVRRMRKALEKGFDNFKTEEKVRLGRGDRGFYMDFYPWRADDGTLFLSLALYSQFHCKEPVFERRARAAADIESFAKNEPPITGPWRRRARLFRQAAEMMEAAVRAQVENPTSGDGFDPVLLRNADWAALGLSLPPAPARAEGAVPANLEIPTAWKLADPGPDAPPLVQFRFPAPLDHYTGVVTKGEGELTLGAGKEPVGMTGFVRMDPKSVTMGEPDLDKALQGSIFLNTGKHPFASYDIESASGDGEPLSFGRLAIVSLEGRFTLKGKQLPISLPVEMEPVLGDDGRLRLLARGRFQIQVDQFDIEGADGPSPANKTLIFDLNMAFEPKGAG